MSAGTGLMSWFRRDRCEIRIVIEIPDEIDLSAPGAHPRATSVRELRTHQTPVPVQCSECGQPISGSYQVRWTRTAEGLTSDGDECLCPECAAGADLGPDENDWDE